MTPYPAGSMSEAMLSVLARALAEDAFLIPIGGSGILGTLGYVDAGRELAEQVARGELPNPDLVVVTCGTGGTAVGLALGLAAAGLETRVLGVCVSDPVILVRALIEWLISRTANVVAGSEMSASKLASEARRRLSFTTKFLGRGYAYPTESGARALAVAADAGLTLDPTYTAKTFAAVLEALDAGASKNVLYWHTLSAAPLEPLLVGAPVEVPPRLAKLLR
jgi:1-aminocyclopropane-1-carboxylate deaminase/D-cysteine desulfhydrase-like pyridoxal-dependent ACC family enzyme